MKYTFFAFLLVTLYFTSTAQNQLTESNVIPAIQNSFEEVDHDITTTSSVNYSLPSRKTSYNNRLGLGVDATFFNISSDDVEVTQGTGFSINFETRGDFRDDFDLIYSLGIFNHNFSVNENFTGDQIDMSMLGVEIKFLLAWKIAQKDYFSIEAGPALQLNGELKIDNEDRYEESFTGGLNPIQLKEFQNTMPVNLNGVVGFSGGVRNFRVTAHYHYSFVDALTGTNAADQDIDGNFSFISVGARFYF
ncbi:hypothetical protein LX97_01206 [Nonlabens dokdonensis]|uniref:Glutamyl-tRNA synthetase n=2 Tax=Nonlabens dokdonensis TaxID=328515 RepID=L7W4K6_NONDD|nr:hypothetical protein [Nonlabens dokdonensis]AGC76545.1 glutamyl-tRNA synthetase [Nonlabens dokdonensis DSW-6]PZX44196.1 hypothetical protein LX97_01206 [Nonlabens dokdonensis]